ncbi:unnamed protein product [Adineta steineri]|uniref:NAD(P)(+)--arginine ADP-ribosyltransferase n=1 Tax=Adineta steineri TaxID=433720 RepID=A0A819SG96_9BILA|nr:unnamed protein product [Adineta steineri]CAF4062479.1 unnamed protein product [Adineta steineri]
MADNNINNIVENSVFIWLDSTIENSKSHCDTESLLRQIVRGRLQTFIEPDLCIEQILTNLQEKRIFFIVSNEFGPTVVPFIHECPQIQTIYVYCGNQQVAEHWTKLYTKITGIFTDKKTLFNKICDDDVGAHGRDCELPMSVFHLEEKQKFFQNLTSESAAFMWYRLLLTVLYLMAKHCNSKTEMIKECRATYHNDEIEQKKINDFEQTYESAKACWWYTYDSCIYRLLNKALRTQNTETIFKFRFFINDLHNQISQLYQQYLQTHSSTINHSLTLYRDQRMKIDEIYRLQGSVNQLISMNSFLSATTIKELAEIFADTSDQSNETSPLQSVLFTINICNMTKDTTPFAFIQNFSYCRDEEEVLFSIGAIFQVVSVKKDNNMWHVNLELSSQQNEFCQNLYNYMKSEIGSEPSPISYGWFLYRINEYDKAERYANIVLKELPENDKEIGHIYNLLGLTYKAMNLLQQSIESYTKALERYRDNNLSNSSQAINTHNNLGLAYLALGDNEKANEHQKQAEEKFNNLLESNPMLILAIDSLKAKIHTAQDRHESALHLFQIVLKKKNEILAAVHPSVATTLNDMGAVYEKLGNYQKALEYFNQALDIYKKILPTDHIDFAVCCENRDRIIEKVQQPTLATLEDQLASNVTLNNIRDEVDS